MFVIPNSMSSTTEQNVYVGLPSARINTGSEKCRPENLIFPLMPKFCIIPPAFNVIILS